jgi:hypothetical protein
LRAQALVLAVLLAPLVGAQDLPAQLTGRLDSSWTWVQDGGAGDAVGLVTGRVGLTAGTSAVKSELRVDVANLPAPSLALNRAWVKFRFPGLRVTTGLGRVAWGPGFVYVPGDLLFDSTSPSVNFASDELRSSGTWLADAWLSLGDEAFVEAGALKDAAALRLSVAPGGVTLEAAAAWNRPLNKATAALSTQFHWGLDWYATLREDASGSAGAFGLWDLGEGFSLTSRHEALLRPTNTLATLRTYHEATLASDAGWSLTGRALYAAEADPWTILGEGRWNPLQNLSLYAGPGWHRTWTARVGCSAQW